MSFRTIVVVFLSLMTVIMCGIVPLIGIDPVTGEGLALLSIADVISGLTQEPTQASRFFLLRLPRVFAGALVGASLAAAGSALQAILRNPLAEPYTLGISSGASLAALATIRWGIDRVWGINSVGIAAMLGAMTTMGLITYLATYKRSLSGNSLILAGITISLFCGAATLLIQYTASFSEIYRFVHWMMGGLDVTGYQAITQSLVPIMIGLGLLFYFARPINTLSAGTTATAMLGFSPAKTRFWVFFAVSLIVGSSIAIAGPIGFVGLVIPHWLRGIVGPDQRKLLPVCIVFGAGFVVFCDTLARLIFMPAEIPVGIITALLGGPFFLVLLARLPNKIWSN